LRQFYICVTDSAHVLSDPAYALSQRHRARAGTFYCGKEEIRRISTHFLHVPYLAVAYRGLKALRRNAGTVLALNSAK